MTVPPAICATFSDYKLVKTRSVIALVFEVPIERQAEVFAVLGFPMPGQEISCGIARLVPEQPIPSAVTHTERNLGSRRTAAEGNAQPRAGAEPERINSLASQATPAANDASDAGGRTVGSIPATGASVRSEQGKARYANSSEMEKALVRAARLPKDQKFREWITKHTDWGDCTEEDAVEYIRDVCCDGGSRKLIAEDRDCYAAFLRLETSFLVETGQMAGPR